MMPPGMTEAVARISDIQQRFSAPPGFAAALQQSASADTGPKGAGQALAPVWPTSQGGGVLSAGVAASGGPPASGPAPDWAARLPEAGRRWAPQIAAAAEKAGVDPRLLASLVWAESNFRAEAGSHAGAVGLAQLMPGTARGLGVNPHDPAENLLGGARYLRAQLDRFGSVELALAAYNAGPGRVARAGGIPRIAETQSYVPKVLGYYAQLR